MNQKLIGSILIAIGILFLIFTITVKAQADARVDEVLQETGTCYTDAGQCLHEMNNRVYLWGGIPAIAVIILGLYLLFFDKTYDAFKREQEAFKTEVAAAKQKDEFAAYLAGFTPEEQSILKAIKEQDGIKQSTLRYRTGMSKAMLSLMLNSLEKRDIITKKKAGKTNEVYLRKKF